MKNKCDKCGKLLNAVANILKCKCNDTSGETAEEKKKEQKK